ncbi:MAG: hypothetical protein H6671_13590 [Anaerolineaceae bacterium]|nr:hypothetical protein [Anaerolineaceae bacterium]
MPQSYKKKRQWWLRPVGVLVILLTVIFITLLVIVGGYTIAPLYNAAQSLTPTFTTPPRPHYSHANK